MTRLVWDAPGAKFAEYGIDRGVLYPKVGGGVPWNGLTGVTNKTTTTVPIDYYFDGKKYASLPNFGEFAATLDAFTYPQEFDECIGILTDGNGLFFDEQIRKTFGLAYRTMKSSDQDLEHGYKLHLVYNASVSPSDSSYGTNGGTPNPTPFSWDLTTVPMEITGYRPTSHLVIDSTAATSYLMTYLEHILYGYEDVPARLPTPDEFLILAANFDPKIIMQDLFTGLSPLVTGYGDMMVTSTDGIYGDVPDSRLIETPFDGLYILEED